MRRAVIPVSGRTGLSWPVRALLLLSLGCNSTAPTAPSSSLTASSPGPGPSARSLNTIFLPAPAPPPSPSPTDPLVGRYQLEIEAGTRSGLRCESVPAYATRRTYTADVNRVGDHYAVKLYDAAFLADSSGVSYGCRDTRLPQSGSAVCHQFLLTDDAGAIAVTSRAEDEWRGSEIWEALPDGFLLAITGRATGLARNGRIEGTGTGSLWYGNGLPASTSYACQSDALRFTFTPR